MFTLPKVFPPKELQFPKQGRYIYNYYNGEYDEITEDENEDDSECSLFF